MSKDKSITKLELQSSGNGKAEVVVHEEPANTSHDMEQFTADFAALSVKENAATSSTNSITQFDDTNSKSKGGLWRWLGMSSNK